jgi:hypothetical protein
MTPLLLLAAEAVPGLMVLVVLCSIAAFFVLGPDVRSIGTRLLLALGFFAFLTWLVVDSVGVEEPPKKMQPWGIP